MTVVQSVIDWLYTEFGLEAIETDSVSAEDGAVGVYRQPTRTEETFVDGSKDVTERIDLRVHVQTSTETARARAQATLEGIESRVRELNLAGNLPTLYGARRCFSVAVAMVGYLSEADAKGFSEYQLTIEIKYMEGRKTWVK